jgi:putative transposase
MLGSSKERNRNISKSDWRTIITFMNYKSKAVLLNPKNSTKRCSRCGKSNAQKGALYGCRCGLRMDRQLNAVLNLCLQMEGLPPTPKLFNKLMRGWRGFTQTGEEADEGSNELERSHRPMNPKNYASPLRIT